MEVAVIAEFLYRSIQAFLKGGGGSKKLFLGGRGQQKIFRFFNPMLHYCYEFNTFIVCHHNPSFHDIMSSFLFKFPQCFATVAVFTWARITFRKTFRIADHDPKRPFFCVSKRVWNARFENTAFRSHELKSGFQSGKGRITFLNVFWNVILAHVNTACVTLPSSCHKIQVTACIHSVVNDILLFKLSLLFVDAQSADVDKRENVRSWKPINNLGISSCIESIIILKQGIGKD